MRTLIAIPVYNELKYAGGVLDQIKRYHREVLVIDDGSTDGTGDYLASRADIQLIRHRTNQGYGQSLIDAFKYADKADYDWVITMDCDEQHEPSRIPAFLREIAKGDADLISGSRYLDQDGNGDVAPGDRRKINAVLTDKINELFGWKLTDTFCGFKAHRVAAMRQVPLTETGYAFPMQLWPRIYKAGLRVRELSVRLIYNDLTRHFGGDLDNADVRLNHYLSVLAREVAAVQLNDEPAVAGHACCCE